MLRRIFVYILIFVIGLLVGLLLLEKNKKNYQSEQIQIIQNGIKNVSKMVVAEENFTQFYQYSNADKYLFETLHFDKKVVLVVTAKVLVSFDLRKMETEIDSIHKKIIIKKIPEKELEIIPNYKYYDLQQSMFNSFTKEELNAVQQSSISQLKKSLKVSKSEEIAKKRLIDELTQLWKVAQIMGWTIEDRTQDNFVDSVLKPKFKDLEHNLN